MAIPLLLMGFVAASLTTGASADLHPRRCPGGKPFIRTLEVSSNGVDCTGFPCALFKGKDTILTATFHTDKAMDDSMLPSVRGTVGGIPLPWAVPAAEGYPKVVAIAGGYSYSIKFPVSSVYPSVRSTVTWDGRDSNGESIYCFKMPVILRTP